MIPTRPSGSSTLQRHGVDFGLGQFHGGGFVGLSCQKVWLARTAHQQQAAAEGMAAPMPRSPGGSQFFTVGNCPVALRVQALLANGIFWLRFSSLVAAVAVGQQVFVVDISVGCPLIERLRKCWQ